jgi:hypothetical protein
LWPERHTAADLEQVRVNVGAYDFDALFQQMPQTRAGMLIHTEGLVQVRLEQLPAQLELVRYWDLVFMSRMRELVCCHHHVNIFQKNHLMAVVDKAHLKSHLNTGFQLL